MGCRPGWGTALNHSSTSTRTRPASRERACHGSTTCDDNVWVNPWITLLAALVGGSLTLAGQAVGRRSEGNARRMELVLEQCSRIAALSEDFRNRFWEERVLGLADRTAQWDLEAHRLAAARLRILCGDPQVITALDELEASGKALGGYWRRGDVDESELDDRYARDKAALAVFLRASARLVRRRLGGI
jgi:hypothetical protein